MKNIKIASLSLTVVLIITAVVLSILGNKERTGYISEFNLDNTRTTETGYVYHARIKYYDKVFRNSDIYGVYPKTDNLPEHIELIGWTAKGSPFGYFSSTKELSVGDKIDNVGYTLKLKSTLIIVLSLFISYMIILIFYYSRLSFNILNIFFIISIFIYFSNIRIVFFKYLSAKVNNDIVALFTSIIISFLFIYGFYFIFNFITKYVKKYSSVKVLLFLELISLVVSFPLYYYHKLMLNYFPINLFVMSFFLLFFIIAFISFLMFLKQLYLEGFFCLNKYEITALILFCFINILYIYIYFKNSREVLIYDSLVYWSDVVYFAKPDLNYFIDTLLFSDYKTFFTIPLSIFCHIFGSSRLVFSISVFIICYFPATFIIGLFARKYFNNFKAPIFIICLLSYFMIPLFTYNLVHSFHMYGAFIFGIFSWLCWIKLKKEDDIKLQILLPIFLVFMFLWKRWMLYWIIPFVIIVVLESIYIIVKKKDYEPFKRLIHVGLVGMLLLVGLLLPRFVRIITENYSVAYSAYKANLKPFIKHILYFYGYYIVIPFLVLSYLKKTRELSLKFLFFILISFYCFLKINRPDVHHLMIGGVILLLVLTLLFSFCYENIINSKLNSIHKNILRVCLLIIPLLIFSFSLNGKDFFYFSKINLKPEITKNINDIVYTYNNLPRDSIIYNSNCDLSFGVDIAALNSLYFQFNKYYNLESKPPQIITSHIDLRDGLNYDIFSAEYFFSSVIPHGCEYKQQVTHYTIEVFNKNINISKAFIFEKDFMYGDITNKLYKRVRQNTKEEIYEYINYFHKYYINNAKFPQADIVDDKIEKYYAVDSNIKNN